MLPVYKVTSFIKVLEKGGRTKPWVVTVDAEGEIRQFVIKFFDADREDSRGGVVNEVLGYVLAKQFDLPMPQAALVECDPFFIQMAPPELIEWYESKDERIKFGTELVNGSILYDPSVSRAFISHRIEEADTIFAFDNLIRNRDRNFFKPNLLIHSENCWLIDHELGFEKLENGKADLERHQLDSAFTNTHIFYKYLKNTPKNIKNNYFDTFSEYLNHLNVKELDGYMQQLSMHHFTINQNLIRNYLTEAKRNASAFVANLKASIQ